MEKIKSVIFKCIKTLALGVVYIIFFGELMYIAVDYDNVFMDDGINLILIIVTMGCCLLTWYTYTLQGEDRGNNEILGTLIILVIVALLFWLDGSNWNQDFKLKNINVGYWVEFASAIPVVLLSWYMYTVQRKQFKKEREINFRNINKNNIDIIIENIKIFKMRNIYTINLYCLTQFTQIDLTESIKKAIKEDLRFLKKLKIDFYYDEIFINMIVSLINTIENWEKLENYIGNEKADEYYKSYRSYSMEIITEFIGNDELLEMEVKDKANENSLKEFWVKFDSMGTGSGKEVEIRTKEELKKILAIIKMENIKKERYYNIISYEEYSKQVEYTQLEDIIRKLYNKGIEQNQKIHQKRNVIISYENFINDIKKEVKYFGEEYGLTMEELSIAKNNLYNVDPRSYRFIRGYYLEINELIESTDMVKEFVEEYIDIFKDPEGIENKYTGEHIERHKYI